MNVSAATYVVITAVRDEEEHLGHTIECMLRQSIRPLEWVIVNDGSTDRTAEIIDDYAARVDWIRAVHRGNRGFRKPGGGVVEAFNDGYRALHCKDWDFIAKFDGDLSFEDNYFETCLIRFGEDKTLGIAGGTISYVSEGVTEIEEVPSFHVRGATKIYRRACWESIGGLWAAPGWDTIDEIKANSVGWSTKSFSDLLLIHHRPTGAADGFWQALVKYGRANYITGYSPMFMLAKCMKRVVKKPRITGAAVMLYGYISGYLKRIPQLDDPVAVAYLRRQQWNKLTGRPSLWDKRVTKPSVSGSQVS